MKHNIRINGVVQEIDCELGSGVLDKNGREIFEGDIVRFDNRALDKSVVDKIYFTHGAFWLGKGTLAEYDGINLEVVGHAED